jgi:large subunit ribosomal protein L23
MAADNIELHSYQVILRPLVTEKGTFLSEKTNAYTFEVHPKADKYDIRRAVEEIWSVRVNKIRTQNRKGKPRRHKMSTGYTKSWKKAIVQLHEDDKIAFF